MLPRTDELWLCALRPMDCIEKTVTDELYKFCSGMSNSFGGLHSRADDDFSSSQQSMLQEYEEQSLVFQDYMWPGMSSRMFQPIKAAVDPQLEIEGQVLIPTKDLFGVLDLVPESANDSSCDIKPIISYPYTPDNDHCYFQPKVGTESHWDVKPKIGTAQYDVKPKIGTSHWDVKPQIDFDDSSDSDTSGNSGDEIDIETVTDEGQSLCALKLQRTLKNGFYQRENLPPVRYNTCSRSWKTSRSTYTRKRTKRLQQSRKSRTKRPRRPPNSLPCSPKGSSRSNSESEEPVRRNMHNNMERMRREEQRTALQHLRIQIPELKCEQKAPKVTILRKAKQYISYLVGKQKEMVHLKSKYQQRHMLLMKKLKLLDKREVYLRDTKDHMC